MRRLTARLWRPRAALGLGVRHDRGLALIALFKFVKAALLILAGAGVLSLLRPDVAAEAHEWLTTFTIGRGQELIARALKLLDVATPLKLTTVGLAAICYGLLFAVEGAGLWLQRRWAEYLTVVTTGALIPFELYEIAHRFTVLRTLAFVVNLAAVGYLILRLRHPPRAPVS